MNSSTAVMKSVTIARMAFFAVANQGVSWQLIGFHVLVSKVLHAREIILL